MITQESGRAFYHVERGAPLVVRTPVADAVVKGTSFSVWLDGRREAEMRSALSTGAAGAVLTVVVYQGLVVVRNDHGEAQARPGEVATAMVGAAPSKKEYDPERLLARVSAENEDLKRAVAAARVAAGGDSRQLLAENEKLRRQLAEAEDQIALGEDAREQDEGVAQRFPQGLPPRFDEKALSDAVSEAVRELGVSARVAQVDCTEFPCIVYGDVSGYDQDTMKLAERLKATTALAAYRDDADHSAWMRSRDKDDQTGDVKDETYFAIAYYPKSHEKERGGAIARRVSHRNQVRWEAMRPPRTP